ncbi:MAG: flagellar brake protein [Nitrospiraceae bacterium]
MPTNPTVEASAENRAAFRINIALPLTFCLESDELQPLPKRAQINLSAGGVGLVTERNLALGDSLSMTLFLPSGPPLQARAKVVRNIPLAKPKESWAYYVGVQFIALDEKEHERLNNYIFKLQIERRRTRCNI